MYFTDTEVCDNSEAFSITILKLCNDGALLK